MHHGGVIAISVGNTRTRVGWFTDRALGGSIVCRNDDMTSIIEAIGKAAGETAGGARSAGSGGSGEPGGSPVAAIASVNDPVAAKIISAAEDQHGLVVDRIGVDIPLPLTVSLDPETLTGTDRLLNAVAAWQTLKQACIVVDAGTAVTIDFVDGEGVFHGGAIAPGAQMQLDALSRHTAQLPELSFAAPDENDVFGRSTAQAMLGGVYHGIRGMVARLIERYAEAYGAFPMVVATGGDAQLLFEGDPLIDRIVPDLALLGIGVAVHAAMDEPIAEDEDPMR